MVVCRSVLSDSILITNDIKESSFSAIRFCSRIGGIGNRTDLTVSDFNFDGEHNINVKQCQIREPDLLIIITGGEMAYTRNDGVKIIPIGCLKN